MEILKKAKKRVVNFDKKLQSTVSGIIENVVNDGDNAIHKYNLQYDKTNRKNFRVTKEEIKEAYNLVSDEEISDIKIAASNIRTFAKAQRETILELKDFSQTPGIILGHNNIPVDSCCCYVPGGAYPLYSTALMLGIPAKVAGVTRVCASTPVLNGTDKINPLTLVAMDVAGIDEIYAIGGAHAIAAFSYGTEQIESVNLIVGPGNSIVTEAKRQCFGKIGIDFLAGPSEVLIIADENANEKVIAADLLAQSEHDFLAKGILITTSKHLGKKVIQEVKIMLEGLQTANIAGKSWDDYGEILIVKNLDEAINYSNSYAPEHLEIMVKNSEEIKKKLKNYGSLFIGEFSAEVFGDYATGTNHTLPTLGAAKYTGGVWVGTFLKTCTYQEINKDAAQKLAPLVVRLAKGEGLCAHANAAKIRLK